MQAILDELRVGARRVLRRARRHGPRAAHRARPRRRRGAQGSSSRTSATGPATPRRRSTAPSRAALPSSASDDPDYDVDERERHRRARGGRDGPGDRAPARGGGLRGAASTRLERADTAWLDDKVGYGDTLEQRASRMTGRSTTASTRSTCAPGSRAPTMRMTTTTRPTRRADGEGTRTREFRWSSPGRRARPPARRASSPALDATAGAGGSRDLGR